MRIRDFLMLVQERLEPLLPPELRSFQTRIRFAFLQVYFDHPSLHYEVWPQKKTGRIEIGLHFEGEGETNYRWAAVLAERMPEVQAALGPAMELEECRPLLGEAPAPKLRPAPRGRPWHARRRRLGGRRPFQ